MAQLLSLTTSDEINGYKCYDLNTARNSTTSLESLSFHSTRASSRRQSTYTQNGTNYSECIKFQNLSYSVSLGRKKEPKMILNNLSGIINAGELTGILGPSGSGKTSLMNLLAGYKDFVSNRSQTVSGSILINGEERNIQKFRKISSYVMQADHLFLHFTVKETLKLVINLKLSEKTPTFKKQQVANDILKSLDLVDCQNTRVLNISGGERKRLCIALELVTNPFIMFLDEPTSGLDSASCYQTMSLLQKLANEGRTLVCTIHHPNFKVFEKFDKIFVLADGQIVYKGKPRNLVNFLSSVNFHCPLYYNPADFVLDIISREDGKHIPKLVSCVKNGNFNFHDDKDMDDSNEYASRQNKTILEISLKDREEVNTNSGYNTGNWTQFRVLLFRSMLSVTRDKYMTYVRLIFHIIVGILLGVLYFDIGENLDKALSNTVGLHLILILLNITGSVVIMLQFPLEREIIRRERINNWYKLRNYYLAKTIVDIPFQAVFTTILVTIFYWMSSQPYEFFRFIYFVIFNVMSSMVAVSFGLMCGAGTNVQDAIGYSLLLVTPILVLGGLVIRFNAVPSYLRWMSSLSYIAFAYEGILITIYGYDRKGLQCSNYDCFFPTPKVLLSDMGISSQNVYIDFIGLLVFFIVFRVISYIILYWKLRL